MIPRQLVIATLCAIVALGCRSSSLPPAFTYEAQRGCDDFIVAAWNRALTEVLTIRVDRGRLGINSITTTEFDLSERHEGLPVEAEMYRSDKHNWHCGDMQLPDAEKPLIWAAVGGRLTLKVGATPESGEYPVTVELTDASFKRSGGLVVKASHTILFTTTIGRSGG
jgi:hypothetical protein